MIERAATSSGNEFRTLRQAHPSRRFSPYPVHGWPGQGWRNAGTRMIFRPLLRRTKQDARSAEINTDISFLPVY